MNTKAKTFLPKTFPLILFATVLLTACSGNAESISSSRTLVVTGVGEAQGVPDTASVQLGVSVIDENIGAAINETNAAMQRVTDAMTARGIDPLDILTTNYNVWRQEIFDPQTGEPTGESSYHVDSHMLVTVRNITDLGASIDAGIAAGANNVMGVNFEISDPSPLQSEARTHAITDAKLRAVEMATSMGVELGDVLSISEGGSIIPGPSFNYGLKGDVYGMGGGADLPPISPGQTTIVSQMSIVYEIDSR